MNATRTRPEAVGEIGRASLERRPVAILAAALAFAIVVGLSWGWQAQAFHQASRYQGSVAGLYSPVKFLTLPLQQAALADPHILPIYGSSELYCCGDPYRPTQLFASQPTGFDVLALGRYGIGNLLFAQTFAALGRALEGKKVVVLDSAPWFFKTEDVDPDAYGLNFSPEIAKTFIFESTISLPLRAAIARRMLDFPETLAGDAILAAAVRALADPTPLHLAAYRTLRPFGRLDAWIERVRGARRVSRLLGRVSVPPAQQALRRSQLDWPALVARATKIADHRDSTNPFGFPNGAYARLVSRGIVTDAIALYRSGSTNRDGQRYPPPTAWRHNVSHSAQWADLALAVAVLKELGAQPFVWTTPLPGVYDDYTPISAAARRAYYDRWEREMRKLGVPWLDFRSSDEDVFFMTDTAAHFSPRGWVFADRALDMFWHGKSDGEIRAALDTLAQQVPPPPTATTWERHSRSREPAAR